MAVLSHTILRLKIIIHYLIKPYYFINKSEYRIKQLRDLKKTSLNKKKTRTNKCRQRTP